MGQVLPLFTKEVTGPMDNSIISSESWYMDEAKSIPGRARLKGVTYQFGEAAAANIPSSNSTTDNLIIHFHNAGSAFGTPELFKLCMATGNVGFKGTTAFPMTVSFGDDYILFDIGMFIPALLTPVDATDPVPETTYITVYYEGA